MIERKSMVDQIEVPVTGGVAVRISLLLMENGAVLSSKWHRTYIPVGISPAEQMAYVNQHLSEMGEAQISSADIQRVGVFHKLATDLPSEYALPKTIEETVADVNEAKDSRKVTPT